MSLHKKEESRARLGSRLGFIFLSAGCAIGLGNVWRFPYIVGQYGGAAFVIIYILFLLALGLPIMVCEFAVGRASQKSAAKSFQALEPKGSKWHIHGYVAMAGNYILMMFYTTVTGWMLTYFVKMLKGDFVGLDANQTGEVFNKTISNTPIMLFAMVCAVVIGFVICSFGLQKGVEKVTKFMMSSLFIIMIILVIRAVTLEGAGAGLKFYLLPDFSKMVENGVLNTVFAALGQSFFTLSIGIGSLAIFGSYIDKERSLLGESLNIAILDTSVALLAGLIIFPACFSFGVNPGQGPGLVFVTLPNIFNNMAGGRIWGTLFFIFMSFAALTTVIAIFENIISFASDLWNWSRKKAIIINLIAIIVLSIPCVLGFSVWSNITPFGEGSTILDLEDFIITNNLLPLGSLVYLLFCVTKYGWGFKKFFAEANEGVGLKLPKWIKGYMQYGLPVVIIVIFVFGYLQKFGVIK